MKESLLENAEKVHTNRAKFEESRRKIENAIYWKRTLYIVDEFFNLVWMEAPNILGAGLYNQLTPDGKSRTLRSVVKRIREHFPGNSPHEVLHSLNHRLSRVEQIVFDRWTFGRDESVNNKWFEGCVAINGTFDPRLMRELWVRDLFPHEAEQSQDGTYYIEDGSHRALVYALNLEFKVMEYMPIELRWCKSWKHILPWAQGPS